MIKQLSYDWNAFGYDYCLIRILQFFIQMGDYGNQIELC